MLHIASNLWNFQILNMGVARVYIYRRYLTSPTTIPTHDKTKKLATNDLCHVCLQEGPTLIKKKKKEKKKSFPIYLTVQ